MIDRTEKPKIYYIYTTNFAVQQPGLCSRSAWWSLVLKFCTWKASKSKFHQEKKNRTKQNTYWAL